MKKIVTCLFVLIGLSTFAQDKKTNGSKDPAGSQRTTSTSMKAQSAKLPYDVNDKYMGRKGEFLNQLTVTELPADFPVFQKELGWGLNEYNAVVQAYYMQHKDILRPEVLRKVNYQETH